MAQIQLLIILIIYFEICVSSNILGIFPFTAKSHFTMFEPLLLKLHSRGHNLTVLSHFPQKAELENYTDISLVGAIRSLNSNVSLSNLNNAPLSLIDNLYQLYEDIDVYEPIFQLPIVKNLLNSNLKVDLIITEIFNTDLFLGFVFKFKAPFIAMSPCPLMPWFNDRVFNPDNPTYVPNLFSPFHTEMDFSSRFLNFYYHVGTKLFYNQLMDRKSEEIAKKYFPQIPPLSEIADNVSLILVNTHFSLHKSAPLSSRVIEVGGMHIKEAKPLNKELERFINEAEHGVILFSMGSMFRSESLPKRIQQSFQEVFEKLQQRVIWKWESHNTPKTTKNILFMKWVPQRDVLSHWNVKLFIYHGGLMGTSEAVYCGVPILGVPLYGDMPVNMAAVASAGAGEIIKFRDINQQSVYSAITKIINNPKYKKNAGELSRRYRDRPNSALDLAVYWTEYVIRHKGAPHLRTAASKLSWFQLYCLDILLISFALLYVIYFTLHRILFFVHNKILCFNKYKTKIY